MYYIAFNLFKISSHPLKFYSFNSMSYQNRTITPNKKARTPVKSPLYETPTRSISNPKKIEHNVSRLSTTAETQGRSNKFER